MSSSQPLSDSQRRNIPASFRKDDHRLPFEILHTLQCWAKNDFGKLNEAGASRTTRCSTVWEWWIPLTSTPYFNSGLGPLIKLWKIRGPKLLKSLRLEIGKSAFSKVTFFKWFWSEKEAIQRKHTKEEACIQVVVLLKIPALGFVSRTSITG